jgi:hypothetical protein
MLYNRHSWRRLAARGQALLRRSVNRSSAAVRAEYDTNAEGEPAPHTDFTSRREGRRLFAAFSRVGIEAQNFDDLAFRGRTLATRSRVLGTPLPRLLGLDLYIVATK